ncbi:thymidine phosphorylase [Niveispirillum lacus]|uniref:Thymidine phosphorylase n=2 Tax=Niveispirillum lacus TaxID=1981099 RepID=A0A255Z3B2_9PROT|nr:thymidine phosphorylase [Niveispirillum lacus]
MFLPQEIIRLKRDGYALSTADIGSFVAGLTDGSVSEGQAAAFAMAVYFKGMDQTERVALLRAMTGSGAILDWSREGLGGPVLDKHSTGGVGDKVSLLLAPIIAACGGYVPMISGRGLGHTGGTLDKMEAIPGYDGRPDLHRLKNMVRRVGCAIVGATDEIAPADRRLYAIRDVTATVESIDLITASILSKKLAAGLNALVLDVKFGSGAFMESRDQARRLAEMLVQTAGDAGLPARALLTDMEQVLGHSAGNALEVRECLSILAGGVAESRLWRVTRALCEEMLVLSGLASDGVVAARLVDQAIDTGAAAERFARMVAVLGGPPDLIERPERHLPTAPVVVPVFADHSGHVVAQDARALGLAVVALGGGRTRPQDGVDPRVGLDQVVPIGTLVGPDRPLCLVHAADRAAADAVVCSVRNAYVIGETADAAADPVAERVGGP